MQVDLCFIIDSSGSIRDNNPPGGSPDNWELLLDFISRLIDLFIISPDRTQIGAVVFSEEVNLAFSLDTYTDARSVKNAILRLPYMGENTNTAEGLKVTQEQCFSRQNGDRPDVLNLAIFISDGVPFPFFRRNMAIQEADALKASGASILAIGITSVIDSDFLRVISSSPQLEGRNYFMAADFAVLGEIRRSVGEGTCIAIEGRVERNFSRMVTHILHGTLHAENGFHCTSL